MRTVLRNRCVILFECLVTSVSGCILNADMRAACGRCVGLKDNVLCYVHLAVPTCEEYNYHHHHHIFSSRLSSFLFLISFLFAIRIENLQDIAIQRKDLCLLMTFNTFVYILNSHACTIHSIIMYVCTQINSIRQSSLSYEYKTKYQHSSTSWAT